MAEALDMQQVAADFDRIALLPDHRWGHNNHYHDFLLRQVPAGCQYALEIGCGKGEFARRLAERAERVTAIDLSENMIRLAKETNGANPIEYRVADVMTESFAPNTFDYVVSIATLHHMPLLPVLEKMKAALRPSGVLAVLDLYEEKSRRDLLAGAVWHMMAVPVHISLNWFYNGRHKATPEEQAAWSAHGDRDRYLSLAEIRQISEPVLPGVVVRRHLLWRYSLIWKKPTV